MCWQENHYLYYIDKAARRFSRPRANCKMRLPALEVSRRGRKQGNLGALNPRVHLEPFRLLLVGGSFNTSKDNKNGDISL